MSGVIVTRAVTTYRLSAISAPHPHREALRYQLACLASGTWTCPGPRPPDVGVPLPSSTVTSCGSSVSFAAS